MSPFNAAYERIRSALNVATVRQFAPAANVRPSGDTTPPVPGCLVIYAWRGDAKVKAGRNGVKGGGRLAVFCESPKSKQVAHDLMDAVRQRMKAVYLTSYPDRFICASCVEQPSLDEESVETPGAFRVQVDYAIDFTYTGG